MVSSVAHAPAPLLKRNRQPLTSAKEKSAEKIGSSGTVSAEGDSGDGGSEEADSEDGDSAEADSAEDDAARDDSSVEGSSGKDSSRELSSVQPKRLVSSLISPAKFSPLRFWHPVMEASKSPAKTAVKILFMYIPTFLPLSSCRKLLPLLPPVYLQMLPLTRAAYFPSPAASSPSSASLCLR